MIVAKEINAEIVAETKVIFLVTPIAGRKKWFTTIIIRKNGNNEKIFKLGGKWNQESFSKEIRRNPKRYGDIVINATEAKIFMGPYQLATGFVEGADKTEGEVIAAFKNGKGKWKPELGMEDFVACLAA